MLVAAGAERTQIVVLEAGELVEHYVARHEGHSIAGNIYLGQVQNVLPGMEAAFVDIGEGRNAVLYAGEVAFDEEVEGRPPRIETVLRSGQPVLTQVVKDPMGAKGARLSTEISLPGRYVVLIPETDSLGISRRLPDEERVRLRDLAQEVRPEGYGMIVRTAALDAGEEEIRRDVARLLERWHDIYQKAHRASPPQLVYSEPELVIRAVRDLFNRDVERVIVNRPETLELIRDYISEVTPDLAERVELDEEEAPLLERFGVLEQIRKALDRRVGLRSGGHIVIDRTEAMTVIDVNTAKFVGKGGSLEETVFKNNLEAAVEIARQLRLRDIGGIIVVDFIDMERRDNREEVARVFRDALSRDKTRTQVFEISELGLCEMTRKRIGEGLLESFAERCPECEGRGVLIDKELLPD
ncbi:MAG: Rne/Rng family ribonuclease [Acidimicrobiales bacterium]